MILAGKNYLFIKTNFLFEYILATIIVAILIFFAALFNFFDFRVNTNAPLKIYFITILAWVFLAVLISIVSGILKNLTNSLFIEFLATAIICGLCFSMLALKIQTPYEGLFSFLLIVGLFIGIVIFLFKHLFSRLKIFSSLSS